MDERSCDVAVIGAGTAGLAASGAARRAGANVVLIESGIPGTTCARIGCMPSKLLIAAADAAHAAATAGVFGIQASVRIDGPAVMARVRHLRDHFVAGVMRSFEAIPADRRLVGHARFVGPNTLMIDEHTRLHAKSVVIATGSRAHVPAPFEPVRDCLLTNDNIFEMADLPGSVAIIGTGPLGLELGQALQRLGVRTAFFDHRPRFGGLRDPALNQLAQDLFGASLSLRFGLDLSVAADAGGVRLRWTDADATAHSGEARFDRVLLAAGRRPNLEGLNLQQARIELDERGTPVFDPSTMRCGTRAIFIAGDVDHDRPLLHEAADEGAIAGHNAARVPEVKAQRRRTPMAVTFSDPQMAVIGDVEPGDRLVGRVDFSDQGRARVMNRAAGRLQVYADCSSGRLTGAEMIGPAAEHLGHLLAWSIQQQCTAPDLLEMPFYHPTLEEGLRTALRDICTQMKRNPAVGADPAEFGPGA